MLARLRDAARAFIAGPYAQLGREKAELRLLIADMHAALEQLNAWWAREAKRESRRAARRDGDSPPAPATGTPTGVVPADVKARVRSQVFPLIAGARRPNNGG